jgi:hypothetical protein
MQVRKFLMQIHLHEHNMQHKSARYALFHEPKEHFQSIWIAGVSMQWRHPRLVNCVDLTIPRATVLFRAK